MAWRIHDSVKRGEIDNRERGVVRGRLWLDGVPDPMVLELKGNACPDLAGCLLTFVNPGTTLPMQPTEMHLEQRGTIGDLTASRRVRVFDIPAEEALERLEKQLPVPEHMANCLYLEWFSEANGRVVVESTEYRLNISVPQWKLTPEEEDQRANEAAAGFTGFMLKVNDAIEAQQKKEPAKTPRDPFDGEELMRESDHRADQYLDLLQKYQDHPERDRRIAEEMGWEVLPADDREELLSFNPFNLGADRARPPEPEAIESLERQINSFARDLAQMREGLDGAHRADPDVSAFIDAFQSAGTRLSEDLTKSGSGAPHHFRCSIVCLKQALDDLKEAEAALGRAGMRSAFSVDLCHGCAETLASFRGSIQRLLDQFPGSM